MKFYYNELSLVVCFTRITVNVPRIVINCFGGYCIRVRMALAAMSCLRRQVRWRASMAAAEFSSHVIPTLVCAVAWDLWLRPFSCFLLDKKALKNQGRHHRTQRTKRTLPRHVGRASAPYPVEVWRSQTLRAKQPCHAKVDKCDGGHLWLRHTRIRPSQYKNPTLHIGV